MSGIMRHMPYKLVLLQTLEFAQLAKERDPLRWDVVPQDMVLEFANLTNPLLPLLEIARHTLVSSSSVPRPLYLLISVTGEIHL